MGKLEATALSDLSEKIGQLPTRTTVTSYEIVKQLAPTIQEAIARGQDLSAIAKLLAASGVRLAPSTISNYLRKARRESIPPPRLNREQVMPSKPEQTARASTAPMTHSALERARRIESSSDLPNGRFELAQDKEV